MPAPTTLNQHQSVKTGKGLLKLIANLQDERRATKQPAQKRKTLTPAQRKAVHVKTDGHCHVCGVAVPLNKFQADHVQAHTHGGEHAEANYLPACADCNRLRWHYTAQEIQLILKLGRWMKTRLQQQDDWALDAAKAFVRTEKRK
jgi:hypothetical protein